jgi:hypothetical protein
MTFIKRFEGSYNTFGKEKKLVSSMTLGQHAQKKELKIIIIKIIKTMGWMLT